MAFGFGPGANMKRDYDRNRAMLGKRKTLQEIAEYKVPDVEMPERKKMSAQELENFKIKFREEKRRQDRKLLMTILAVGIIISVMFYLFMN